MRKMLFKMTEGLNDEERLQLEEWIGGKRKFFTLLFKISRDGCNPEVFHKKCDNQGPTVTVLYTPKRSVYGAYTSISWKCVDKCVQINDPQHFICQLQSKGQNRYQIFKTAQKGPSHSTIRYGPIFCGLSTFSFYTVKKPDGVFTFYEGMRGFTSYNYNTGGVTASELNDGSMNVVDLEVYKVSDLPNKPVCSKTSQTEDGHATHSKSSQTENAPETSSTKVDEIIQDLVSIRPPRGHACDNFRVLLVGPRGSCKSSVINTLTSALAGRLKQPALTGEATGGVTKQYKPYTLRTSTGEACHVRLCDTPGLHEDSDFGLKEMKLLLDGHVPDGYRFNRSSPLTPESAEYVHEPTSASEVHCVVMVIDASGDVEESSMKQLTAFKDATMEKSIPLLAILTKIDILDTNVVNNLENVFDNENVNAKIVDIVTAFRIPGNCVMPIQNYWKERIPNDDVNMLALDGLPKILLYVVDFMESNLANYQEPSSPDVVESDEIYYDTTA